MERNTDVSQNNNRERFNKEVKKLIRKAEISRQSYFHLTNSLIFKSKLLHSIIIIFSSMVAILTFANYQYFKPLMPSLCQDNLTLFVGMIASAVFILTVIEEYFSWSKMVSTYEEAGKKLTTFIRTADGVQNQEVITEENLTSLRNSYIQINQANPPIPDNVFLKSKKDYLVKRHISEELDRNAFLSFKEIKRMKKGSQKNDFYNI